MDSDNEIVFRIPAPSDGIETVLVLFGIGAVLLLVLTVLQHRPKLKRGIDWLKAHPWERASATVNLLSWPALIFVGPVAAVLFLMALGEAYALLQQDGGSSSGVGSLGRSAVIVALIGAPFVIWRSVVAQRTVNVTEQGHITDRINKAVEGLGAEKTVTIREFVRNYKAIKEGHRRKDDEGNPVPLPRGDGTQQGRWDVSEETQPNLEVRIGAIYALERIAQDSDRDHVQIMEILCAYIRQNALYPVEDDWPELEMHESGDVGALEDEWELGLEPFGQEQHAAKARLEMPTLEMPREDIQTALTVIGRRDARQRRLEAGRGVEAPFPFDTPCPEYAGPDEDHNQAALDTYWEKLEAWTETLHDYTGYQLDLRGANLRGADLSVAELGGARLDGTDLQGANLSGARLQGTRLGMARLPKAHLVNARLQGSHLMGAQLQGADLDGGRLQGANLGGARLQGANLGGARLQAASLMEARLQGARLLEAQFDEQTYLTSATLKGSDVRSVDFTKVPQIAAHLPEIFGDASVTLPGGHGPGHRDWPAHWPKFEMDWPDFLEQWREWQADPDNYHPPDPPEPSTAE